MVINFQPSSLPGLVVFAGLGVKFSSCFYGLTLSSYFYSMEEGVIDPSFTGAPLIMVGLFE
jgi:hypothetical protein